MVASLRVTGTRVRHNIRVCIRVMRHGRLGTINWADRLAILTLDTCHVRAPLQNWKFGAQSDSHILANDGLPLQPSYLVWR
jgi:hypothetical protein